MWSKFSLFCLHFVDYHCVFHICYTDEFCSSSAFCELYNTVFTFLYKTDIVYRIIAKCVNVILFPSSCIYKMRFLTLGRIFFSVRCIVIILYKHLRFQPMLLKRDQFQKVHYFSMSLKYSNFSVVLRFIEKLGFEVCFLIWNLTMKINFFVLNIFFFLLKNISKHKSGFWQKMSGSLPKATHWAFHRLSVVLIFLWQVIPHDNITVSHSSWQTDVLGNYARYNKRSSRNSMQSSIGWKRCFA